MLAWDTETALIRPARLAPELACLTFSDGERSEIVHWRDAEPYAKWLLERETATANGPYDCAVLWAQFPNLRDLIWDAIMSGRLHDVITRQKLIDIGEGCYRRVFRHVGPKLTKLNYSLSDLNARYFGAYLEKDEWRLKYGELREHPLLLWHPGARQYAMLDAQTTARVYDTQESQREGMKRHPREYLHNEKAQVQANWALHLMSCWGFSTDDAMVEKTIARIDAEQPELARQMAVHGLINSKGKRKTKRAKQMLYDSLGNAAELTTTGFKKVMAGELTREEALKAGYIKVDKDWCKASGRKVLVAYGEYSNNQLLRSKLQNFRTGPYPLQTSYEGLLETGRTSSSENRLLPNSAAVQNLSRKVGMRECLVSRPGTALLACDFGMAELVSLAQVCYALFGYSKLRDALNEGKDPHMMFAASLMKLDYDYISKERKRITRLEDKASAEEKAFLESIESFRQLAKAFNFGAPGGLGAEKFVSYARKTFNVVKTEDEIKVLKEAWFQQWPEIRQYFQHINNLINQGQPKKRKKVDKNLPFIKSVGDIQQYGSRRWRGGCRFTVACNTLFQGLTADAAKAALVEVSRLCYTDENSILFGCRPVAFIHDEIIMEAPLYKLHACAKELERIMVAVYQSHTPDVRITADAHAMWRWSKKAKEVHDDEGKLIPWDDGEGEEPEEKVDDTDDDDGWPMAA